MPHQVNVVSAARSNEDFRRVLFTGERSQLVVMTIPPGGEVGDERHDHVEQTLFCLSGNGTAILDGSRSPFARWVPFWPNTSREWPMIATSCPTASWKRKARARAGTPLFGYTPGGFSDAEKRPPPLTPPHVGGGGFG